MKKTVIFISTILCINHVFADDDITIVALNDFHGQVQPYKNMVGAGKISTFLQNYRKQYPNLVVVLAGDNYQGTAISNLSSGQVDNDFFNYIDVKYSAIGNHEFDYGINAFESWNKTSNFKFLAANIIESNGSIFRYAEPYGEVFLPNGKHIGFIGLSTLETPATTAPYNIKGLSFSDPVKASNKWVDYLNSFKHKPDTIILLTHIPSEQESTGLVTYDVNPELKLSEIDYVTKNTHGISALISGHSHMLVSGFMNNVAIVQGASQGKDLSVLHYDCHSSKECVVTPEVINLSVATKDLIPDPKVESMINYYAQQNQDKLNQVITKSSEELSNKSSDGNYNIKLTYTIAELMRNMTHVDIALQNTYGIRRSLPKGDITYNMIYEAMPFDNTVTTLKIKGSDLMSLIQHSLPQDKTQIGVFAGVKIILDKNQKIKKVLVNNQPLENYKLYTLATINFLIGGGDGFDFSKAIDVKDTNIPIREEVREDWLKNGINVPSDWQNIKISN